MSLTNSAVLAGISFLGFAAQGQAQPHFEVASVRGAVQVTAPGANARTGGGGGAECYTRFSMDAGRIDIGCLTLVALMSHSFRIVPDRIVGPAWMGAGAAPRFDIAAKLPQGATAAQVPEMLQALLAERFKLAVHREMRERAVYALVVAKGGLKGKSARPEPPVEPHGDIVTVGGAQAVMAGSTLTSPSMGTVLSTKGPDGERMEAASITFEGLAGLLSTLMVGPVPIVDMTGLKGRYQVVLEFSWKEIVAAGQADDGGGDPASNPAITAAQLSEFQRTLQKMGLQLERRRAPVETIVVDHVEATPTEN